MSIRPSVNLGVMLFIDASMFTCKYCFSGVTLLVDAALVERKLSEYEDLEVDALFDFDLGYTEELVLRSLAATDFKSNNQCQ